MPSAGAPLPSPVVQKRRLTGLLVWLIPAAAAAGAAWYARVHLERNGPLITVEFSDASGIRVEDTPVLYRGVEVGRVVGVELSDDKSRAAVKIRLQRRESAFAAQGAAFWRVSPEVSASGLSGVNTLLSGPYIDSLPGAGEAASVFAGLRAPPGETRGLRLLLRTPRLQGLRPGAAVSYRGVQVGVVRDLRLSRTSDAVEIQILVWSRYRALVRKRSRFWTAGGIDVKGGLLKGLEMRVESLRALVAGGVDFATPEKDMGEPAANGVRFDLEDEPPKDWVKWAPRLPIEPSGSEENERGERLPTGRDLMDSKL